MKALILSGDGINSDKELAMAFEKAGFESKIQVFSEVVKNGLKDYDVFAIPGGFSFGDDLGSGKVLALKLQYYLKEEIENFIADKKLILGICNGFQVLVHLGLLPGDEIKASLVPNEQEKFLNLWVPVRVSTTAQSPWLKGLEGKEFFLPIRHGEGRFLCPQIQKINKQIALQYTEEVNGSDKQVAGIIDNTGYVFGLMPHPEAAYEEFQIPFEEKSLKEPFAFEFFKNAYEYSRSRK